MLSLIAAKQWMPNNQGVHLTSRSLLAHLYWRGSRCARGHLYMQPLSLRPLSSPFTPRLLISDPRAPPTFFLLYSSPVPSINLFLPAWSSSLGSCGQLDGFVFDTCVGRRRRTPPHTLADTHTPANTHAYTQLITTVSNLLSCEAPISNSVCVCVPIVPQIACSTHTRQNTHTPALSFEPMGPLSGNVPWGRKSGANLQQGPSRRRWGMFFRLRPQFEAFN